MNKNLTCFSCDREIKPGETYYKDSLATAAHPYCRECTLDALLDHVDVDDLAFHCGWHSEEYEPEEREPDRPETIPVIPGQIDMFGNIH
jgi:hypothetical protein